MIQDWFRAEIPGQVLVMISAGVKQARFQMFSEQDALADREVEAERSGKR
jgi:hypothetical protein